MKVAFITHYDVKNIRPYSGIGYYIAQAFQQQGLELKFISPLKDDFSVRRFFWRLWYRCRGQRYLKQRDPVLLKAYARQVEARLANLDVDIIFSPGTLPLAYLETRKPMVCWCDATFDGLVDFYPKYSNLSARSRYDGHTSEQLALSRCQLAIYSSDWAAQTALENYKISKDKVKVVLYGANVEHTHSQMYVATQVEKRLQSKCSLLFVGVDWYRKGGDVVLQVAKALHQRGIPVELNLVGSHPVGEKLPEFVNSWGFISKSVQGGRELLDKLFSEARFLLLPTRADCVPVVIAEANSYGVPVITTDVGGISTVVHNDLNGMLFSPTAPIEEYLSYILNLLLVPGEYRALALRSFHEYKDRLNWGNAAKSVINLLSACTA